MLQHRTMPMERIERRVMSVYRRPILAAVFLLVTACTQDSGSESNATTDVDADLGPGSVATVDGVRIPESLFRVYALTALQTDADSLTAEQRDSVIGDVIDLRVLANAAETNGLQKERTIAARLELARLQLLARSMALRYLEENPATDEELRAKYEESLPNLATTQYKARHILVDSQSEAASIIEALDAGGDFAALAKEKSTGADGGDLGWFSADSMVEPIADAVSKMTVGQYSSEPVQTQYGWHVISLDDVREAEPPGLDAVRTELTNAVEREKLEAHIAELREKAEVVVE